MCIRRGDLRSPAGEHSSPLPCSENILMRTLLMPDALRIRFVLGAGIIPIYGERAYGP